MDDLTEYQWEVLRRLRNNSDFKIALPDEMWLAIPPQPGVQDLRNLEKGGLLVRTIEHVHHGVRYHIFKLTELAENLVDVYCDCNTCIPN